MPPPFVFPPLQIVRLRDVFESGTHIFLVQELCSGGSLGDLLRRAPGPLAEARAARLFRGVVKSVLHCHQLGILHRDVKPDNFLLSNTSEKAALKLADFGLSTFFRRGVPEKEAVGSPFYMAPEMVTRGSGGYGPAADLFSCGVILYRLLTGSLPFPGDTTAEVFHALRYDEADFVSPAWRRVSPSARHLVRRLLEKDPSKRIEAQDVLTHEWMTSMITGCPPVPAAEPAAATSPSGNAPAAGAGGCMHRPLGGGPQAGHTNPADSVAPSVATSPAADGPETGHLRNRVGDQVVSARIFYMPADERARLRLQGFLDTFRRVEDAYQQVLTASDPDAAALYWEDVCLRLKTLDGYLADHASRDGPFFLGSESGLAEASTAPALFRMSANLADVRRIELLPAVEGMGLERLAAWLTGILEKPSAVCDVDVLGPDVYVALARKLHVRYQGPPSPCSFSPRPSLDRDSTVDAGGSARELSGHLGSGSGLSPCSLSGARPSLDSNVGQRKVGSI